MTSRPLFVFVHGFLGSDRGRSLFGVASYFRGVGALLRAEGAEGLFPVLPAAASVETRARALARALEDAPARNLVLVGHSQGGLDARVLASRHDPARRVRAVVTLGAPHRGSFAAEALLRSRGLLGRLARGPWRSALEDLTTEACLRRNETVLDRPDVTYLSVAGVRPRAELPSWLGLVVPPSEAPSDGLVTVESARWGARCQVQPCDHFELVGWTLSVRRLLRGSGFDHDRLYRDVVAGIGVHERRAVESA